MHEAPRKKGKKKYHSFEAFHEALQVAITAAKPRHKLTSIREQLRRGIEFPISTDHVEETCRIIKEYPDSDLLYFSIVCDAEFGRASSPLLKRVASNIVRETRIKTEYPVAIGVEASNDQTTPVIHHWLEKLKQPPTTSDHAELDASTARSALICLLPDIERPFFPEVALEILRSCIRRTLPKKSRQSTQNDPLIVFAKTIASYLEVRSPQETVIRSLMVVTNSLRTTNEKLSIEVERSARALRSAGYDMDQLKSNIAHLKQSCLQKDNEIRSLQDQLNGVHKHLLQEKERYHAAEEYWQDASIRRRNETVYKIKSYLDHEIQEMQHCLDRESPNIRMAIDRINNIDRFLTSLENI